MLWRPEKLMASTSIGHIHGRQFCQKLNIKGKMWPSSQKCLWESEQVYPGRIIFHVPCCYTTSESYTICHFIWRKNNELGNSLIWSNVAVIFLWQFDMIIWHCHWIAAVFRCEFIAQKCVPAEEIQEYSHMYACM